MIEKLILGTAGLSGQPYGRNKRTLTAGEVRAVIRRARELGITKFDTAPVYGFAEELVGERCHECFVFTKSTGDRAQAVKSLERLKGGIVKILYHNWSCNDHVPLWMDGVTTYQSDVRGYARKNGYHNPLFFEFVQLEWNLLSQSDFRTIDSRAKIIARSVFLQGLLNGGEPPLPALAPLVATAQSYAQALGVDLPTLALRAALEHKRIDYVVVGPTTIEELEHCVEIAKRQPLNLGNHLSVLESENEAIVDPRRWNAA